MMNKNKQNITLNIASLESMLAKKTLDLKPSNTADYPSLVGKKGWQRLHPDIKKRFSTEAYKAVVYQGIMKKVCASFAGKCLSQICRLIGTPLALHTGRNIPMQVRVYQDSKLGGMTWDRLYYFPKKMVNRVKSTKCIKADGQLVEMVGFGFGMQLKVYEKQTALCFESTQFFWQLGQMRINLPDCLSPGKTLVCQKALKNEKFEFSLSVTHCWLGKLFEQVGIFEKV